MVLAGDVSEMSVDSEKREFGSADWNIYESGLLLIIEFDPRPSSFSYHEDFILCL